MPRYNDPYVNPYASYPYTAYNQNNIYQQPMYQNQSQVMQQPQTQMQMNYMPLVLVDNIDEVKRYIVQPNQVVYLKIRNSNVIYEKSANNQGEYAINEYSKIDNNSNNGNQIINQEKIDLSQYITKSDFEAFKGSLEERMNNLSSKIEKRNNDRKNNVSREGR